MLFILIILALPTLCIGVIGEVFLQQQINLDFLSNWLHLSINSLKDVDSENFIEFLENAIPSIAISFIGILIAFFFYGYQLNSIIISSNFKNFNFLLFVPKSLFLSFYNWSYNQ